MAGAPRTWPGPVSCSKCRRPKTSPNPSRQPMTGQIRSPPLAPVAAEPWSSSRPSTPAMRPAPRHQPRARAHDDHHINKRQPCLPPPPATAPLRSRTSRAHGSANKSLPRQRQGVEVPPRRPHRHPDPRHPTDPATRHRHRGRRQIPIDRTARTAQPNPPAVSFPEASPTPATRDSGNQPSVAGVREPLTEADIVLEHLKGH